MPDALNISQRSGDAPGRGTVMKGKGLRETDAVPRKEALDPLETNRAAFHFWQPPLPRLDPAWAFCHLRGAARIGGRVIQGAVVETNDTTAQHRFVAVPLQIVPTPDGSLTHAMSWIIERDDFTPVEQ